MTASYFSISIATEGLFKEKGSKFISFAIPVETEDEVKIHLVEIKKKYFDARHVCFAFRLGPNGEKTRAFDDGEPNYTAGVPILNQIKSFEISDVLVVVIRYFGGTKLGVSGLIQAYKEASLEALKLAEKIEKIPTFSGTLQFEFEHINHAMSMLKNYKCTISEQNYTENFCVISFKILQTELQNLKNKIEELSNFQIIIDLMVEES